MNRHVIFLYPHYYMSGGFPRELEQLARAVAEVTGSATVVGLEGARSPLESDRLTEIALPNRLIPYFRTLTRTLRNSPPTAVAIVVDNGIPLNLLNGLVLRFFGIPYVVSLGDVVSAEFDETGLRRLARRAYVKFCMRWLLIGNAHVRVYSTDHLAQVAEAFAPWTPHSFIATEGIDWAEVSIDDTQQTDRTREAPPANSPLFGYLGRLEPHTKGLDLLVEAWSRYRSRGGSGDLVLAGPASPSWDRHYRARGARQGISEVGVLSRSEKIEFLKRVDVLVMPSRHEGVPRALREAIALQTPVLVSPQTNLADIVEHSGVGWVSETRTDSLEQGLFRAAREYQHVAPACFREASAVLDWHAVARTIVDQLPVRED